MSELEELKEVVNKSVEECLKSLEVILKGEVEVTSIGVEELRLEGAVERIGEPDSMNGCIRVDVFGMHEIKKSLLGHFMVFIDEDSMKNIIIE